MPKVMLIITVSLLVVIAGLLSFLLFKNNDINVGDYVDKSIGEAISDLQQKQFPINQITQQYQFSSKPVGTVIEQSQQANASLLMNQPINLKISKGTFKIGDYVEFGKYNDLPIMWRIIHIDEQGDPVLFSDKVLSTKVFNAEDLFKRGQFEDETYKEANNNYQESNLRQWLNSDDRVVQWTNTAPSKEYIYPESTPYDKEKGFLADGNFSALQRAMIKPITHRVVLSRDDADIPEKKDGGQELYWNSHSPDSYEYDWQADVDQAVANYDRAFYQTVEDRVFVLSVKQLNDWVYQNPSKLGADFHIASYWLNTANWDGRRVHAMGDDGYVFVAEAIWEEGVRPATVLQLSSVYLKADGNGQETDPFVVEE
jgi:hypothetical protein